MREHFVRTPDDRTVRVVDDGADGGVPVVVHHGCPGSAMLHPNWVADARGRGLRLLAVERAGYGGSTRQPGRRVADAAADAVAVVDAIGADRFLTWGVSGGGPHALACAALAPDRVAAAASLASVGPYGVEELDFFADMGPGNIEEFGLTLQGEAAVRPSCEESAAAMVGADFATMLDEMTPFLSEVDAAEMRGPFGPFVQDWMRGGLVPTVDGWVDDDLAYAAPWGFDVADIAVPVLVVQGRQDLMVPYGHGAYLAGRIPDAERWLSEEDGHLTLVSRRLPDVHAWLAERWAAATAPVPAGAG